MKLSIIGLRWTGSGLALKAIEKGHQVVGYNKPLEPRQPWRNRAWSPASYSMNW